MNIGSSSFQNKLGIIAATAISSLFITTAFAGPNQLDILGLVPGISELSHVKQVGFYQKNSYSDVGAIRLEIGGHKMTCPLKFLNGKLASLTCLTGKGKEIYEQYTAASNTEVHSTLTSGFMKKFGKPDSVIRNPVRTRVGVEHEQQLVTWKDKRGNTLQLLSIVDTVNMGMISLNSAEHLKQEAEKKAAEEARKKF